MENLAPGFRFYPTEEELVSFYLKNKLRGTGPDLDRLIPVLDIYEYNPVDLPQLAGERSPVDGDEWFFFIPRHEREARGGRPNRLTTHGYWKATGSPGDVYSSNNRVIGRKRTMVFYVGRAPNGVKTEWKMNEYKVIDTHDQASSTSTVANPQLQLKEEFSLCRIYRRSKFLRAFDRRPAADPTVRADQSAMNQPPPQRSNIEAASTLNYSQMNPEIQPEIIDDHIYTTILDEPSGDHTADPSGLFENHNMDSAGSFWDSEDFMSTLVDL